MRQALATPTGVERRLSPDEFIVSKTDVKGVITYANDVFLRIAGYTLPEVLGQPHNLIRHPDMPQAVFKLLWDTLAAEQEIFAYVVNLASDGAHYWVFAHVTPTYNRAGQVTGYHSNRRAPDQRAIDAVVPLYAQMLAAERRHSSAREGMAASAALLGDFLAEKQLTYDELVWAVTP